MTKRLRNMKRRGMSLVEILIYTAILAVLFVLVVNTVLTMAKSYTTLRLAKQINLAAATSLERIAREIQNAISVDQVQSVFGTSPGSLSLNTLDPVGNPKTIQFFIEDGALRVREDGVDTGPMIGTKVTVTNLTFSYVESGPSEAVKIVMSLQTSLDDKIKTATFYDTIILRGSYGQ